MVSRSAIQQQGPKAGDAVTQALEDAKKEREQKLLRLAATLKKCVVNQWYGKITVSFEGGNITHVKQEVVDKW